MTFVTGLFVLWIYSGGVIYTLPHRGLLRALVWPVALGIALAKIADREMRDG